VAAGAKGIKRLCGSSGLPPRRIWRRRPPWSAGADPGAGAREFGRAGARRRDRGGGAATEKKWPDFSVRVFGFGVYQRWDSCSSGGQVAMGSLDSAVGLVSGPARPLVAHGPWRCEVRNK
jgi:hypothetical protein